MGKHKNKQKTKQTRLPAPEVEETIQPASGGGATRAIAIGLFALGIGVVGYAVMSGPAESSLQTTVQTAPSAAPDGKPAPYFDSAEDAKPFPVTLSPSEFDNDVLEVAYRIAKDIPEVLAQQPCLCGCDATREGHGSLLDCFIDQHAST